MNKLLFHNCITLNSHLLQAMCSKFVYNVLCGFGGIVGGYGPQRMYSYCLRASCGFLKGPSGAGQGKSIQRLCGDCTEIVQSQRSCYAVSADSAQQSYGAFVARRWCGDSAAVVQSPQTPHGNRTEPVWRRDGVVTVQPSCHFWVCGLCVVPVRGLCNATYYMSTGYRLTISFFKFV